MKDENKTKEKLSKELENVKRKLKELHVWEERYKSLVRASPYAVTLTDLDGNIIDLSRRTLSMYGYRRLDELLGKSAFKMIAPKDRNKALTSMQKALEKGHVRNVEYTMVRKNGKRFIGELDASLIKDTSGNLIAFIATTRDITKQRQSELALKRSEERYKSLFMLSPQAVVTVNMKGVITSCNPAATKMTGIAKKNLIGKDALKLRVLVKQDIPRFRKILVSLVKGKVPEPFECGIFHTDGTKRWVLVNIALFDEGDGKKGIQAVVTDITYHKKVEMALRESEEKYKALFDRSLYGVFVHDLEGNFIDANQAFQNLMGYKKGDVDSLNFAELLDEEQLPLAQKTVAGIIKSGYQKKPTQYKLKRKDGNYVWMESESSLIYKKGIPYGIVGIARDITKQKKAEKQIARQIRQNEQILSTTLDGYIVADTKGKLLEVNKAYCDIVGYSKDELLKMNIRELEVQVTPTQVDKRIKKMLTQGSDRFETRHRRKDGQIRDLDVSIIIMKPDDIELVAAFVRDVTFRKNAEQALIKSEEKYRKIFEALTDVYYRTDKEGIVTEISPSVLTQAGWDPEDVIGHPVSDFYRDPSTREIFANTLKEKGIINDYELQLLAKDGQVIEVSVSSHIMVDAQGQARGVEGVLRDITTRKQMEGALRESEEKFRAMVENSLQGIFIIQDFRIVYANDALAHITGYSLKELLSLPSEKMQEIVHPEDQEMVWGRMADRLAGKDVPARYVFRAERKDGTILWIEMVSGRIEFKGKPAVQGAVIDITDRQQAEEKIKASLKEKEVMLREIHHRVKNNMQIILSLLRIQSHSVMDKATQDMFKQSQNRIRSMALIHEALYKSDDLARIDIADYIGRMSTHLLTIYRQDLGDVEIIQKAEGIFLDINRAIPCGLIISELVSNCLKHAFPGRRGGNIIIRMTKNKKGAFRLMVKDNGIGLPEGLDYRETETLGLQLVTDLVQQINGSILLKKTQGTEFIVKF